MYTVYKITNKIDSRYYIGVHKTEKADDEYMGSGLIIRRLIKKYGKKEFAKEVLYAFETAAEAFTKEIELIDILDVNCLNLAEGGRGGATFTGRTHSEETRRLISERTRGKKRSVEVRQKISENNRKRGYSLASRAKQSETMKAKYEDVMYREMTSNAMREWWKRKHSGVK